MLISELSRRSGIPPHRLRYYEDRGLLAPQREGNGYRSYDDDALVTVTQVRKLLEAGLSTEEIRFLQPCITGTDPDLEPCDELLTALQDRRQELDRRINTLNRSRSALERYIRTAEQRRAPACPGTTHTRADEGACQHGLAPAQLTE